MQYFLLVSIIILFWFSLLGIDLNSFAFSSWAYINMGKVIIIFGLIISLLISLKFSKKSELIMITGWIVFTLIGGFIGISNSMF